MYVWYSRILNRVALSYDIDLSLLLWSNLGHSMWMVPVTVDPMED